MNGYELRSVNVRTVSLWVCSRDWQNQVVCIGSMKNSAIVLSMFTRLNATKR